MAKEIILSQSDLNEKGIKTQLNQNDLLEVLVSEVYDNHIKTIEATKTKAIELVQRFNKLKQDAIQKAGLAAFKKTGLSIDPEKIAFYGDFSQKNSDYQSDRIAHLLIVDHRQKTDVSITNSSYLSFTSKISGRWDYREEVSGKEHTKTITYNGSFEIAVDTKPFKKLFADIKAHNEYVEKLNKEYEGVNLNYTALARDVRVKFNKSLIAKGAPKLKAKIASTFGIELE